MVIVPEVLLEEIAACEAIGLEVRDRLVVSPRAHVTFPFQASIDRAANLGPRSLGTTGRGIGPTYSDKAARLGVRLGDLCDPTRAPEGVRALVEAWRERARVAGVAPPTVEAALEWAAGWADAIAPLLGDAGRVVDDAIRAGNRVLLEGAQGTLLDLDHGTYPFVTSSNTVAGGACTGLGIGPTRISDVVGITKAYCTRVGNGPFPTELHDAMGERIRAAGGEYGATTGRPRRCGWIDLPALRYAARVNGLTALAVTKLDVLAGLGDIPVCVGYRVDGAVTEEFPIDDLGRAEPVWETLAGWDTAVAAARREDDLPASVRTFLARMEAHVSVPVAMASVGAEREATVVRREVFGA
jgi:adenylosuccinate synthase